MNTIKKLFNGEIYPFEAMHDTKEMLIARNKLYAYLEEADKACPKEDGEPFSEKIFRQISDVETLAVEQGFEMGFPLGLRLATESYNKT